MEIGAITESVTVTGSAPLIETSNASQGTVLDTEALQTLPAPGRAAFLVGVSIPTVIQSGDGQFNRQQDQTNASLLSLGGGTRRGNNYTLDGVPITDINNRAVANPTIEALDDVKVQVHTYDAEMGRTGGGVFNTTLQVRHQQLPRHGLLPDAAGVGRGEQLFQPESVRGQRRSEERQAGHRLLPAGRRLRRPDREGPHLLLVRERELPRPLDAQHLDDVPDRGRARRRFLRADQHVRRSASTIYDPLTHLPFPGNVIPPSRINPVAANILKYLPLPQVNVDNGSPTTPRRRRSSTTSSRSTPARSSTSSPTRSR